MRVHRYFASTAVCQTCITQLACFGSCANPCCCCSFLGRHCGEPAVTWAVAVPTGVSLTPVGVSSNQWLRHPESEKPSYVARLFGCYSARRYASESSGSLMTSARSSSYSALSTRGHCGNVSAIRLDFIQSAPRAYRSTRPMLSASAPFPFGEPPPSWLVYIWSSEQESVGGYGFDCRTSGHEAARAG